MIPDFRDALHDLGRGQSSPMKQSKVHIITLTKQTPNVHY